MNTKTHGSFICPSCGKIHIIEEYRYIDTSKRPEIKEDIISGNFMGVLCSCGFEGLYCYSFIYHDPIEKLYVYVNDENDEQDFTCDLKDIINLSSDYDDYQFRIVYNYMELLEKILLKQNKFDDRIMEFLKAKYLKKSNNYQHMPKISGMYYDKHLNINFFLLIRKDLFLEMIEINMHDYKSIKNQYLHEIEKNTSPGFTVIDYKWASSILWKDDTQTEIATSFIS